MNCSLGIYADTTELDHDTTALLEALLTTLQSRGVDAAPALASIRRIAQGFYR